MDERKTYAEWMRETRKQIIGISIIKCSDKEPVHIRYENPNSLR